MIIYVCVLGRYSQETQVKDCKDCRKRKREKSGREKIKYHWVLTKIKKKKYKENKSKKYSNRTYYK